MRVAIALILPAVDSLAALRSRPWPPPLIGRGSRSTKKSRDWTAIDTRSAGGLSAMRNAMYASTTRHNN